MQILDSKTNFSTITNHLSLVQKSSENGFFMIIKTLLNHFFFLKSGQLYGFLLPTPEKNPYICDNVGLFP